MSYYERESVYERHARLRRRIWPVVYVGVALSALSLYASYIYTETPQHRQISLEDGQITTLIDQNNNHILLKRWKFNALDHSLVAVSEVDSYINPTPSMLRVRGDSESYQEVIDSILPSRCPDFEIIRSQTTDDHIFTADITVPNSNCLVK